MSITSSLNAGVSGLSANAARLASISDNIANASTFGYRRADTDFDALVIGSSSSKYTAGGVKATTTRLVDTGGALVGTSNPLDLAISGGGLLPVRDYSDAMGGKTTMLLTPTGAFRRDADGFIKTENGLVLLGWPANSDGTIPNYPRDTASDLVPIRIEATQRSADPTTEISVAANLPADATAAGANGEPYRLTAEYFGNLEIPKNSPSNSRQRSRQTAHLTRGRYRYATPPRTMPLSVPTQSPSRRAQRQAAPSPLSQRFPAGPTMPRPVPFPSRSQGERYRSRLAASGNRPVSRNSTRSFQSLVSNATALHPALSRGWRWTKRAS